MRLLFVCVVLFLAVLSISASTDQIQRNRQAIARFIRDADDEEVEPDERDIEEVKAALARKPKIARPAYSSLGKKKKKNGTTTTTTTTEATPITELPNKVEQPRTERPEPPTPPAPVTQSAQSAPKVEARRLEEQPSNELREQPSPQTETHLPQTQPQSRIAVRQRPSKTRLYSSSKTSVPPSVVSPVPASDLLVPGGSRGTPVREYKRRPAVNSLQEKPAVLAQPPPLESKSTLIELQPGAAPVARGSRPRTVPKSKYLDDYPIRAELSPVYRSKQLVRAEVSEDPYEDCPYGWRLSACLLRAQGRLR